MRTLIILVAGLAILTILIGVSHFATGGRAGTVAKAALAFVPIWFVATGYNMWVGVNHAGYTVTEEAPIFALLFGIPAAAAIVVWRKYSRP